MMYFPGKGRLCAWVLIVVSSVCMASAALRAPSVFSDHMVLQRDRQVPVWGWADPGEEIAVQLDAEAMLKTRADNRGRWQVELPPHAAGGPHTLAMRGANTNLVFKDVLFGEVWLCSGQSNMQWTVAASKDAKAEIAAAHYPEIRHLAMPRVPASQPVEDRETAWTVCSPDTVPGYTAVGYFFGRALHRELKVPIGLLNASWGGTRIEPWTPIEGFARAPALQEILEDVKASSTPSHPAYRKALETYLAQLGAWTEQARQALEKATLQPPPPVYPPILTPLAERLRPQQQPTTLYNGMIHPLVPYAIRGAIWYQGESNRMDQKRYVDMKKALVAGWRQVWNQGVFPFYFVQIAPFEYGQDDPSLLPQFWEAQQQAARAIEACELVVIHDVGNIEDIHPKNKQEVGRRLSLLALARDYGRKGLVVSGPTFKAMKVEGAAVRVTFNHTGSGLVSRDGKALTHFELMDAQAGLVPARAVIDGDSVLVTSEEATQPVGLRFGWHKVAEPNLMNKEGLPAVPFRAGTTPPDAKPPA